VDTLCNTLNRYQMVTVQGITQCIHSIAVPTVCNANVQGITQCIHYIAVPTLCNGNVDTLCNTLNGYHYIV
jgi:hypothetical protein